MSDVGWYGALPVDLINDEPMLRLLLDNKLRNAAERAGALYVGPVTYDVADDVMIESKPSAKFVYARAHVIQNACTEHRVATYAVLDAGGNVHRRCPECERVAP